MNSSLMTDSLGPLSRSLSLSHSISPIQEDLNLSKSL
jgi:hypothetical protein